MSAARTSRLLSGIVLACLLGACQSESEEATGIVADAQVVDAEAHFEGLTPAAGCDALAARLRAAYADSLAQPAEPDRLSGGSLDVLSESDLRQIAAGDEMVAVGIGDTVHVHRYGNSLLPLSRIHQAGSIEGLWLVERHLITVSQTYETPTTTVTVHDLTEPLTPRLLRRRQVSGRLVTAHREGHRLRFLVRFDGAAGWSDLDPAEALVRSASAPPEAWLPSHAEAEGGDRLRPRLVDCEQISHPDEAAGHEVLSAWSIDLAPTDLPPTVVAASGTGRFGPDSLFLATGCPTCPTTRVQTFRSDSGILAFRGSLRVRASLCDDEAIEVADGSLRLGLTAGDCRANPQTIWLGLFGPGRDGPRLQAEARQGDLAPPRAIRFHHSRAWIAPAEAGLFTFAVADDTIELLRFSGLSPTNGLEWDLHPQVIAPLPNGRQVVLSYPEVVISRIEPDGTLRASQEVVYWGDSDAFYNPHALTVTEDLVIVPAVHYEGDSYQYEAVEVIPRIPGGFGPPIEAFWAGNRALDSLVVGADHIMVFDTRLMVHRLSPWEKRLEFGLPER